MVVSNVNGGEQAMARQLHWWALTRKLTKRSPACYLSSINYYATFSCLVLSVLSCLREKLLCEPYFPSNETTLQQWEVVHYGEGRELDSILPKTMPSGFSYMFIGGDLPIDFQSRLCAFKILTHVVESHSIEYTRYRPWINSTSTLPRPKNDGPVSIVLVTETCEKC